MIVRFLSRVDTRGWGWIYRDFKADYATLLNYHARRAPFNEAASIISRTSVGHTSVDYPDPFFTSIHEHESTPALAARSLENHLNATF